MAGKRGRSGPPQNSNATKHGWKLLWNRGILCPQDSWVKKPIADTMLAFASDLPNLTARERETIETIATAKGCELLISHALQQCGLVQVVDGRIHVAKASEDLARFMKLKLDALRLLPTGRRAKVVASLSDYLNTAGRPDVAVAEEEPLDESA
jgi:hypothetical protein